MKRKRREGGTDERREGKKENEEKEGRGGGSGELRGGKRKAGEKSR